MKSMIAACLLSLFLVNNLSGTILTFDTGEYGRSNGLCSRSFTVIGNHGSRSAAPLQDGDVYTKGTTWTPNVVASYASPASLRGAYSNCSFLSVDLFRDEPTLVTNNGKIAVSLTADAGWDVVMESADIQLYANALPRSVSRVVVIDGTNKRETSAEGSLRLRQAGGTLASNHLTFSGARSSSLTLEVVTGEDDNENNVGVDNVRFYQIPTGVQFFGDANRDQNVDVTDFSILSVNFGKGSATWEMGDFDSDGRVSLDDFTMLRQNFGSTASAAVPEPSGLIAGPVLLAFLAAFRRRRAATSAGMH